MGIPQPNIRLPNIQVGQHMVDVRASRAADDAVRTAKPSQPKRIVLPAWIALALFLVVDSSGRAGAAGGIEVPLLLSR